MGRKRTREIGLPERVYVEHGTYWYRPKSGEIVRLTRKRGDIEEALRRVGVEPTVMRLRHLGVLLSQARQNAKTRAIDCALTKECLHALWRRSGGRCELTNIQFDLAEGIGYRRRPYAPSIDRIDSSIGYSLGNCRLVLVSVNLAMNEWGEQVFARIARGYVTHSGRKNIRNPKSIQAPNA